MPGSAVLTFSREILRPKMQQDQEGLQQHQLQKLLIMFMTCFWQINEYSAETITETVEMPRERVGFIIRIHLGMQKLSARWVLKCLDAGQK